jgi:putative ABC transport system permease protein
MSRWAKLALKRLLFRPGVTLLELFGIVLAVGLVTSTSFFARGVDRAILREELEKFNQVTGRPPFSAVVQYSGSSRRPLKLEDAENFSGLIGGLLSQAVGLPLKSYQMQASSGTMMLRPPPDSDLYEEGKDYLASVRAMVIPGMADHIRLIEGNAFDETANSETEMDIWMHDSFAQKIGARPGDRYGISVTLRENPVPVRLAGIWVASDPEGDFWYNNPDNVLADAVLVRRTDYQRFLQRLLPSGTRQVSWYVILDESRLRLMDIRHYIDGFEKGQVAIDQRLPGARLSASPLQPLEKIVQRSRTLAILLQAYNLPALCILLAFLMLNGLVIARWQQREVSTFVSRGMRKWKILAITLSEQFLLFLAGLPLGIGAGMWMARGMGYAGGFLSYTARAPLPVALEDASLSWAFLALGFSLLARLWAVFGSTRQTLVAGEREWARPLRRPFWQRHYLDFLLLLPSAYLYDQIARRGALGNAMMGLGGDFYRDPIMILAPALLIFTAALAALRLFTLVVRLVDSLAGVLPGFTVYLSLRYLGRQNQDFINPLLLVMVSIALGIYTLSMSASLDRWASDQAYYAAGADITFTPEPPSEEFTYEDGSWIPFPEEFQQIDGVLKATRVADLSAGIRVSSDRELRGHFLGIDRAVFPEVAWFRRDFADEPLVGLMNKLALHPMGILVPERFLQAYNLKVGDQIRVLVSSNLEVQDRSVFTIVGTFRYFPTFYEDRATTVVGNLDAFSTLLGYTLSHQIWMRLRPGASGESVLEQTLAETRVRPTRAQNALAAISRQGEELDRVGVWGTHSEGFLAAAGMAFLGLMIFSYASLRERVHQFAILRSLGLGRSHLVVQVCAEYAGLAVFGAATGVSIGALISRLIMPYFQATGRPGALVPPLLPVVPEQTIWELGASITLLLVLAELATVMFAMRRSLAELVKSM